MITRSCRIAYKHLTFIQRCRIYGLWRAGHNQAEIAKEVGMHKSTISRELKNYLKNSHLEINNNLVENDVRPFAVGRKNWLFAGSSRRLTVHTPNQGNQ